MASIQHETCYRYIDVVLISDAATRSAARDLRDAGASEVLSKPVSREQLPLVLSSFLS